LELCGSHEAVFWLDFRRQLPSMNALKNMSVMFSHQDPECLHRLLEMGQLSTLLPPTAETLHLKPLYEKLFEAVSYVSHKPGRRLIGPLALRLSRCLGGGLSGGPGALVLHMVASDSGRSSSLCPSYHHNPALHHLAPHLPTNDQDFPSVDRPAT
jgi:hypothetical protein